MSVQSPPRLRVKWTDYIPHQPTAKQLAFLMLPHREAFYGGAAGGGKSDALLMGALQYVDVPGYASIIFRKTLSDLQLEGALIARSHEWLNGTPATFKDNKWIFPCFAAGKPWSPENVVGYSTLQFGYMGAGFAGPGFVKLRYQGAEFQYIAFDEVTQHWEEDYLYMFSRLRRPKCPEHHGLDPDTLEKILPDPSCPTCRQISGLAQVPLRMRSASNPGGMQWVKERFAIKRFDFLDPNTLDPETQQPIQRSIYRGTNPHRPHIPAFVSDNPFLDQEEYIASLQELDPVTREQLLRGDWGISADGRFRKSWIRYFTLVGGTGDPRDATYFQLGRGEHYQSARRTDCRCFVTCDPAASLHDSPGKEQVWKKKMSSFTVICIWMITPQYDLLLLDMIRVQVEIPDIFPYLKQVYRDYSPEYLAIEHNGINLGVYQVANRLGLPVKPLKPRAMDKLVRATDAMVRMEQGKIWLLESASWLDDVETELFTWTGHPAERDDIVDNFAYAAMEVSKLAAYSEENYSGSNPEAWTFTGSGPGTHMLPNNFGSAGSLAGEGGISRLAYGVSNLESLRDFPDAW